MYDSEHVYVLDTQKNYKYIWKGIVRVVWKKDN